MKFICKWNLLWNFTFSHSLFQRIWVVDAESVLHSHSEAAIVLVEPGKQKAVLFRRGHLLKVHWKTKVMKRKKERKKEREKEEKKEKRKERRRKKKKEEGNWLWQFESRRANWEELKEIWPRPGAAWGQGPWTSHNQHCTSSQRCIQSCSSPGPQSRGSTASPSK